MKVLLPYLIGAASAFVVQFLIQIYVVPLVETRKRREERWEQDVLELGELLSTSISEAARRASAAQFSVYLVTSGEWVPQDDHGQGSLKAYASKLVQDSHEATRAFRGLVDVRADWITGRIIDFRVTSDKIVAFAQAAYLYRIHIMKIHTPNYGDMPDEGFHQYWESERELRTKLINQVKALARLRHPPRPSLRRRFRRLKIKITSRLKKATLAPKAEPAPAAVDGHAEASEP